MPPDPLGTPLGAPSGRVLEWRSVVRVLRSRILQDGASQGSEFGLRHVFDDLTTTIFPDDCRVCGGPLVRAAFAPVCDLCLSQIPPQSQVLPLLCGRCGESLGMESACFAAQFAERLPEAGLLCTPCRRVEPAFARAVAYGVYEDGLRELVHLFKYEGMRALAEPLSKMLAQEVLELVGEAPDELDDLVVVAVPLFGRGLRERGYNQAVLLADAAVAKLRRIRPEWRLSTAHSALLRVKATKSQYSLSARERRRNLAGAFAVADPAAVAGREVLLIDDIYTTGATARACAGVLQRAGARRVWVATLARAQQESTELWDADG